LSKQSFELNGKETFLYSGEVHYFRIPRRYWEKHLKRWSTPVQCGVDLRAVVVA